MEVFMEIVLSNGIIKATINTLGAELTNLVNLESGFDHMWTGDPAYWTGRSPVLFPIIGSLNGGAVKVDGKSYSMGNHGFARKSEFQCICQDDHSATFRLTPDDAIKGQYPFDFILDLTYTLIGTAVSIGYTVTNSGDAVMPFQLGTHAAFKCPMGNTNRLDQWYLEFEKKETLGWIGLRDNLIDVDNVTPMMADNKILPLTPEQFYEGAIVFKEVQSGHIALKSNATEEMITVSFTNMPDLGIWQPVDAPFLCIEPWKGHGDPVGFQGELIDKMGCVLLEAGKEWTAELRIRIGE